MKRTSFFNHVTITIVATLLCYAPLASCAPGADEDSAQSLSGALVGQTLLEAGVLPICRDYFESQFGINATDKLVGKAQCERGARAVHDSAKQGEDTATGADVDVYFKAQEWAATNRPVPVSLTNEVQQPETAKALVQAAKNGFMDTPLSSRQAELWVEVAQGRTSLREFFAETRWANSEDVSNASGDITATQLGLANAETAGVSFVTWGRLLVVGLSLIAVLTLAACGGVRQVTVDIGSQPIGGGDGSGNTPLPTPDPGVGSSGDTGTYSAVPQFEAKIGADGSRQIWPVGGWINTINHRWQRAAGGRPNPDRGGAVERGLAAIEDLFQDAPDGFQYASVYTPLDGTNLPWITVNATNWFVDVPGSPKLGPYAPDRREVTFPGDSVTYTVFWFVVSSEAGKASMLTDIYGNEQGANNPLVYRTGTKPLLVFTSLENRGDGAADLGYDILFGSADGAVTYQFVDVPGNSEAAEPVPGYAAHRLGAGVASDGTQVTGQPYAIINALDGQNAPSGSFQIGFGYVGPERPNPTFDFHVTFQAQ